MSHSYDASRSNNYINPFSTPNEKVRVEASHNSGEVQESSDTGAAQAKGGSDATAAEPSDTAHYTAHEELELKPNVVSFKTTSSQNAEIQSVSSLSPADFESEALSDTQIATVATELAEDFAREAVQQALRMPLSPGAAMVAIASDISFDTLAQMAPELNTRLQD